MKGPSALRLLSLRDESASLDRIGDPAYLLVNGDEFSFGFPKGRVIILKRWFELVSNYIGKGHARNPLHMGQDRFGLVENHCGRGQVKGDHSILGLFVTSKPVILKSLLLLEGQDHVKGHLHKLLCSDANLAHGTILVLDPEDSKLELGRRYFGNWLGRVMPNQAADAVNIAILELDEDLFVLQELFIVKGGGHHAGEAKHDLVP